MLSLSIILPLLNAQIDQPIAEKTVDVLGLIGFKQGEEMIPINGTSIPLNINDTIWLLALSDLSLEYGPMDRNVMNNVQVSAGKEIFLRPEVIKCCDTAVEYRLKITSQSIFHFGSFEEASLLYVGNDESRTVTPSLSLGPDSVRIKLDGLSQGSSTQLALLKPGTEQNNASGRYGAIQYRSVVKPQSTLQILYDPNIIGGGIEPTVHFMLISSRTFMSETIDSENIMRMYKDGIVASTKVKVNRTANVTIPVNIDLSLLGEPGTGGDTPLQFGLHFLYIHIEGEKMFPREQGENMDADNVAGIYLGVGGGGTTTTGVFLPIYVLKNDGYTLIDQTQSSEGVITLSLSKVIQNKIIAVATPIINGVTSSLYSSELMIQMTEIAFYDGDQLVSNYELTFEPNLPSTQLGGVTYVLGETLGGTTLLTQVKIFNFTLPNFEINGEGRNEIGFSEILNLTSKLNQVKVSTINDLGEPLSNGWVIVEKGREQYKYSAGPSETLRIPSGTYTIKLIVGENIEEEKTIIIDSSQTITLTANTIQTLDLILLAIILIEIPAVAILGIMIIRSNNYP